MTWVTWSGETCRRISQCLKSCWLRVINCIFSFIYLYNIAFPSVHWHCLLVMRKSIRTVKPRLHDTTCRSYISGWTNSHCSFNRLYNPVWQYNLVWQLCWMNRCSSNMVVKPGLTAGWTNSGCLFNTVVKPNLTTILTFWHLVVSCKWGIKKLDDEMLAWLCLWSEVQKSSWCRYHRIVSCFIKIQLGVIFLVLAYPGVLEKRPLNGCLLFLFL